MKSYLKHIKAHSKAKKMSKPNPKRILKVIEWLCYAWECGDKEDAQDILDKIKEVSGHV